MTLQGSHAGETCGAVLNSGPLGLAAGFKSWLLHVELCDAGQYHNLSEPQLPHLENGGVTVLSLTGLFP